jgi:hypothetical protein
MLVVERAVQTLIENGDNPSVAAFNMFPALKYLPRWFPGTGFHTIIDESIKVTRDMLNVPFEHVRKCMVRNTFQWSSRFIWRSRCR